MRDASDPGFAALDATITKALMGIWELEHGESQRVWEAARAVREALVAAGQTEWRSYPEDPVRNRRVLIVPLGVVVAPDQHNQTEGSA